MPGRLDVRPLLAGAMQGLRRRRVQGMEPADGPARYVLFGLPVVAGAITTSLRVQLNDAGALAGACGILIGALLTSFGTVGVWKERLVARDRDTEKVNVRALDEAAAHILVSVLAAMIALMSLAIVSNAIQSDPGAVREWVVAAFAGLGVAGLVYLAITLVIVVNLLWDAFIGTSPARRTSRTQGAAPTTSGRPRA